MSAVYAVRAQTATTQPVGPGIDCHWSVTRAGLDRSAERVLQTGTEKLGKMCLMALSSDPRFRVHHALRIKGFAKVDDLAPLAGVPDVAGHLGAMLTDGLTQFREQRGLRVVDALTNFVNDGHAFWTWIIHMCVYLLSNT